MGAGQQPAPLHLSISGTRIPFYFVHYAKNSKNFKIALYFSKAIKYNADSRNSQREKKGRK